jgi:beta-glucanase (GH16 family)
MTTKVVQAVLLAALLVTLPVGAGDGPGPMGLPASNASSRATDVHSGWTLLWNDEFDLPGAPNSDYWSHEVNCSGGGNNEWQCYTDRLDNSYVDEDGLLHIVAKEEFYSGPSLQDEDPDYPGPYVFRNYTSARLRTRNKVDWKYGRIEVRAQVPGGRGMWPAIWMLPTNWEYGGWPSSGEIDVFEAVNLRRDNFYGWGNFIHGTLHYGLPWPQWENHGRSHYMYVNPADDFHQYALEWEEDEIHWYVDGVQYQTQRSEGWYNYVWGSQETGFVVATDTAPFDQIFHLLMNVAVGGDWPGPPDSNWNSDREMLVDYVRVYQCARGSVEGKGKACGTIDPAVEVHEDAGAPGLKDYVVYDDGFETLGFEIFVRGESKVVENTLVPGSFAFPGVTVDSEPSSNGAWEIEFTHTGLLLGDGFLGNVFLGSADMSDVEGVATGFNLEGGSSWSTNGELEFDIKVKSIDPETRLFVKMDSGYPGVGFVEIEIPDKGRWHHVAVKIADLLANRNPGEFPLDLRNIQNVFVLESTGPAHVWVDDIRLQCAFNTEPEWWQIDKTCALKPRIAAPTFRSGFSAGVDRRECLDGETDDAESAGGLGEIRPLSPSCSGRGTSESGSVPTPRRFSPGRNRR